MSEASKITLDDVRKASPVEDPEEVRMMDFLERSNSTGKSERFFDAATSIPSEIASQASTTTDQAENTQSKYAQNMSKSSKQHSDERNVESALFTVTNSINELHYQMSDFADIAPVGDTKSKPDTMVIPGKIFEGNEGIPQSEADRFAANAGQIYNQYKSEKELFPKKKATKKSRKAQDPRSDIERQGSGAMKQSAHYAKKMKLASMGSLQEFKSVVVARRRQVFSYVKNMLFFVIIPSTLLAAIFFYLLGNPGVGESLSVDGVSLYFINSAETPKTYMSGEPTPAPSVEEIQTGFDPSICRYWRGNAIGPTISWWILFLGVRQVIAVGLAQGAQHVIIYYALKINFSGMMGPTVRLFLLQAKGWPFVLILWSVFNFALLFGPRRFSEHWLYYQDWVGLFNQCNPSGSVTANPMYGGLLAYTVFLGILVAVKRFAIGLRFGKASYFRYAEKLSEVLKELLIISKLAKKSRNDYYSEMKPDEIDDDSVLAYWNSAGVEEEAIDDLFEHVPLGGKGGGRRRTYTELTIDSNTLLNEKHQEEIAELLGEWEDIELSDGAMDNDADLSSIIQFRASIGVLESTVPYSPAFGVARTRNEVIEGCEELYDRLLKKQEFLERNSFPPMEQTTLRFHTIALTAVKGSTGHFDRKVCKSLIKLFRPGRDGLISKLEFCKSIDSQYKELRKLRASIVNEGKVNIASERIINTLFYGVMIVVLLGVLGIDPVALFGVMTSVILGFSFMIRGASSEYFRGLLFITLQRPYDIGDRINVAAATSDSSGNGASGWIVKDVNLYHTTFIFGTTNEYATISNGSLSNERIINAARSQQACLNFVMKFGLAVPGETVQQLKDELMAYVKDKPREWLAFSAFRMTRVEADLGFVEYKIVCQHRESWQQIGALLESLAALQSFAFERSRALGMTYKAPSRPIEMKMMDDSTIPGLSLPTLSSSSKPPPRRPPTIRRQDRSSTVPTRRAPSSPARQALFGR